MPPTADRGSAASCYRVCAYLCESVADQPPDRPHIRNTQNYAPNSSAISVTSKKRTKSRSHQLWKERAVERAKRPVRRRTQSSGPARKAAVIGLPTAPSRQERLVV